MYIHISYYIILCWISIILIYIALIGDRLLQHQALLLSDWILIVSGANCFSSYVSAKVTEGQACTGFSLLILVLSSHPCLSLTPREIEISGCCRWARLSTAWLQSWDHSGLNLSKIIGDCYVSCLILTFFCGHKLRTARNSLWTLPAGTSHPFRTAVTRSAALIKRAEHRDMFPHDSPHLLELRLKWKAQCLLLSGKNSFRQDLTNARCNFGDWHW